MLKRISIILLLASVMIGGCNNPNTHLIKIQKSNIDPKTGNLIVLWLQCRRCGKEGPIIVTEPHAVYMEWYKDFKVFYIYDNVQKITYKTTNFDVFLEGLKTLPEGTKIQQFDSCTAPRLYDIPRSKSEEMTSVFIDKKLSWATSKINGGEKEIFCTCSFCCCEGPKIRYP
ncbi:MAG: hypothetical protein ABFR90_10755 [Planctomycetota bacterium]